ncbi:hypothetical protein [Microcoleus sp. N9_A1]|uniref:hypothetical protein n=1 Tax=Microcoleus sp. N9_A1 TaxID=3055380 RepID=UPI002FD16F32
MAIDLGKGKINKEFIKVTLKAKILEAVEEMRITRALERQNINRAIGVGQFNNFEKEFNTEYAKSRTGKDSMPSKRKLKKVSQTQPTKKLV